MPNHINTKEYYDSCIKDCNDYDSLMKGHYKFVLDVTEVQKVCLNKQWVGSFVLTKAE